MRTLAPSLLILTAALSVPGQPDSDDGVRLKAAADWRQRWADLAAALDKRVVAAEDRASDPKGKPQSKAAAQADLKKLRAERAALVKSPFDAPGLPVLGTKSKAGDAGRIPGQPVKVLKREGDGWVVEAHHSESPAGYRPGWSGLGGVRVVPRFELPAGLPKEVSPKVGAPLSLPGYWVVTAAKEVGGRPTLTVVPLKVHDDELPEDLRAKKKKK